MPRRHDDKDAAGAKTIDTYYNVTIKAIEAGAEVHIHLPTCSEVTFGNGAITITVGSAIETGAWRHYRTESGREYQHEQFVHFVEAQPLEGLGATIK